MKTERQKHMERLVDWMKHHRVYFDGGMGSLLQEQGLAAGELPEITDLVMSCRVMGRNIENAVIDRIEEQMQEEGYTGLRGRYIPTAKNKPVEALYEKLGYHRTESTQEGGTCYEITLAERPERAYWLKETLYD